VLEDWPVVFVAAVVIAVFLVDGVRRWHQQNEWKRRRDDR
jgi:hypothetical protein